MDKSKRTIKWFPAPMQISFGHHMVIASLAIDKDHTLTFYCEEEMIDKVNKMLENVEEYGQT